MCCSPELIHTAVLYECAYEMQALQKGNAGIALLRTRHRGQHKGEVLTY